ncbi:hypothetical protein SDC9_200979 [bioreactor metagenome]|uniref:DUF2513 domain-containing protein n=1 Tax=bioreactor metagenome TaxID=1076179 RepID=A0A645IPN8_9ZZZZ
MQRDMDLMRKILLKIEEIFPAGDLVIHGVPLDGYDKLLIADHCQLLFEAGLINAYEPRRGGQGAKVLFYSVGNLTNSGYDFLDKIREDTVWNRTKTIIKDKGLPMVVDVVKEISSTVISSMVEGAIKGLKQ